MEPTGSEKAAKIDSKGGPQGFKMEYKCMHFGNASIDFFLLTGARRKRMWALAPKTRGFSPHRKIDFRHGILMQFINGKEWAFVSVMMIEFLDGFGGGFEGIFLITAITTTAGLLSMIVWTLTGHKLMDTLRHERKGKVLVRVLAGAIFMFAFLAIVQQLI